MTDATVRLSPVPPTAETMSTRNDGSVLNWWTISFRCLNVAVDVLMVDTVEGENL
jgi:hypothetical protein